MYHTDIDTVPTGYYGCIYADPPWVYRDKALAGRRGAGCKYTLTDDTTLRAMPVGALTGPDATCFMWVTYPKLAEGLALMTAWGFTYKTVAFTWVKRTKLGKPWFWGMGRWTRANPEIVLLGTKGHPRRRSASVHSIVDDPIGAHSRKPQTVRDRITTLIGADIPKLELFARGETPGWDAFGNTPVYAP